MSKSLPQQVVGIILGVFFLFITGGIMAYLYVGTTPADVPVPVSTLNLTGIQEMQNTKSNVFESVKSLHQTMTADTLQQTVTYKPEDIGGNNGVISPVLK